MTSRKCARDGCFNQARESKGGMQWQKLCVGCQNARKERSARSKAQPKCKCGNCLPMDGSKCRACQERDESANSSQQIQVRLSRAINRLREAANDLESGAMGDVDIPEELRALVNEFEYIQAVI